MKKLFILLAFAISLIGLKSEAQTFYTGQIILGGWNFCPRGFTSCEGQLLAISSNTALFSLLGTTYGGDGRTTFGIPDLRGRYAMNEGTGAGLTPKRLGQRGGQENVTLNATQIPAHTHPQQGSTDEPDTDDPSGAHSASTGDDAYATSTGNLVNMGATNNNTGGGQSHENMSPFLVLKYCMCLFGTYPPRN